MKIRNIFVVALFISAAVISFLTPIGDNDFFWHLATGKWIAEQRELPATDPFSFTTSLKSQEDSSRAKIMFSMYWAANLLQFGVFSLGGFNGIIALRICIILFSLLVLSLHMRKKGLNAILIILLLLPVVYILTYFQGDRPNQMTFLFCVLFMFLLDALKRGEKKGYLLPVLIMLWANMHGGFILGAVFSLVVIVSELLRKIFLRGYFLNRPLLNVLLLTIVAGFLNPNGYAVWWSMITETSSSYTSAIAEMRSPWVFTSLGKYSYIWMLLPALFLTGWYFVSSVFLKASGVRKAILGICDEFLLLAFLAGISFTAIRYIPLFILVMVPVVAPLFAGKFQDMTGKLSQYLLPELLIAALSLWWIYGNYANTVLKLPLINRYYPDDAVQFIKHKEMKGRFYNYYDWGGYLIWQFYPEKSVFIDGRGLSMSAFNISEAIINDQQGLYQRRPVYSAMLDSYSVRHIIIPAVSQHGHFIYLVRSLENDPDWRLVFTGHNSLVYTRDAVQDQYPKSLGYVLALSNALEIMQREPDNPVPYLTFARANIYLGRRAGAINGLEVALKNRQSLRGGPVEKALKILAEGQDIPVSLK